MGSGAYPPSRLRAVGLVAVAALAAGCGATPVAPRGSGMATIRPSRSLTAGHTSNAVRRWPMSMCRTQPGHRFSTTTVGDGDLFVAEPVSKTRHPRIGGQTALRHFHTLYGPTTAVQDRHMQVRYGLISDETQGAQSDNAIGYVPWLRRTGAWMFTNCHDPSSPADYGSHHVGGQMYVIIADTVKPKFWTMDWEPAHPTGKNPGEDEVEFTPHPTPKSTRFYSTPWTVADRKPGKLLLTYQPRHCYTLDHVYDEVVGHNYHVSVILSTGPHGTCPKQSATAPYTELLTFKDPPKALRHLRTGRVKFEPESS